MNASRINSILSIGLSLGLAAGTATARADNGIMAGGQRALAQIEARATAQPTAAERLYELQQSLVGARIILGLEALRGQRQAALASIQAELKQDMLNNTPALLHPGVKMTQVVGSADNRHAPDNWSLPGFEIKPLIDPTVLFFSFQR